MGSMLLVGGLLDDYVNVSNINTRSTANGDKVIKKLVNVFDKREHNVFARARTFWGRETKT
jgi:hypothetical protein